LSTKVPATETIMVQRTVRVSSGERSFDRAPTIRGAITAGVPCGGPSVVTPGNVADTELTQIEPRHAAAKRRSQARKVDPSGTATTLQELEVGLTVTTMSGLVKNEPVLASGASGCEA